MGEVLVDIDDADDGLLPDTNVTVTVTTSSEPNALSIPREALHSNRTASITSFKVVWRRSGANAGDDRHSNLTQVPILSGLQEGDRVATGTTNGQPLQEGVPIKVRRSEANRHAAMLATAWLLGGSHARPRWRRDSGAAGADSRGTWPRPTRLCRPARPIRRSHCSRRCLRRTRRGQAQNLVCRVRFTLEQWDAGRDECEQAVQLDGQNSDYHHVAGPRAGRARPTAPHF